MLEKKIVILPMIRQSATAVIIFDVLKVFEVFRVFDVFKVFDVLIFEIFVVGRRTDVVGGAP